MFAVPCRIDRRRSESCIGVSPANNQRAFLWVIIMAGGSRLIFGVGINDSSYTTRRVAIIDGSQKTLWECPLYSTWKSMIRRCYSPRWLALHPSYIGHSVRAEWLRFSVFSDWMANEDFHGKHLDKDLLRPGNKEYSPDSCVFISGPLNVFLVESMALRGDHPLGVHFDGRRVGFVAQVNDPFSKKRVFLGVFRCPNAAHEAWRSAKHAFACRYADMQANPRVAQALRTRYLPVMEHN